MIEIAALVSLKPPSPACHLSWLSTASLKPTENACLTCTYITKGINLLAGVLI
jgi:hypothetical protein